MELYRFQWVGLAVIAVLPVLSFTGILGDATTTDRISGARVVVTVERPSQWRISQLRTMEVRFHNRSGAMVDSLHLALDSSVMRHFVVEDALPAMEEPFTIPIGSLAPGQQRTAVLQLRANRFGASRGSLIVSGADSASLEMSSVVLP